MTTLAINIENKIGLNYSVKQDTNSVKRPLNKAEEARFKRLKSSLEQIKLHKDGKIKLQTIEELLAELF